MRIALFFSYDGTNYHGWQFQPNASSVQQKMQEALKIILRQDVALTGAGRTDTGVHAREMAAHFDLEREEVDLEHLKFRLNSLLPQDIAVNEVKRVSEDWHARFSPLSRTYHYYITSKKNPFNSRYALRLYFSLDVELMNEAAELLLEHEDFGCFCKSHSQNKTNICHISEAKWEELEDGTLRFRIKANRFLRNMVRAIVGTLIEVGRHRLSVEDFKEILLSGKRTEAGESVPAKGLFLQEVEYAPLPSC